MLTQRVFLITKPEPQAQNLAAQIKNLGGESVLFPTLAIKTLPAEQIVQALAEIPTPDKVIFTSANAVLPVMPYWKKIAPISASSIFAVGSGTAKVLAAFQISAQTPTEFNSEGLLALPELQAVHHQQIVIFSGVGGRTLLKSELEKRGASVQKIAVYQRECPTLTAAFPPVEHVFLIITTSEESLQNLWKMAGEQGQVWLREQRLLVISDKMQLLAQQLGFKQPPIQANNASDEAILDAITSYHLQQPQHPK